MYMYIYMYGMSVSLQYKIIFDMGMGRLKRL
jgi:hypothetical protein